MKLYYKGTNREVQRGDVLTDFRGNQTYAYYWTEPTHGEGKICTRNNMDDLRDTREHYVSVYNLEWRFTEDDAKETFGHVYPDGNIVNVEEVNGKYVLEAEFSDGVYYHIVDKNTISHSYEDHNRAISAAMK